MFKEGEMTVQRLQFSILKKVRKHISNIKYI